MPGAKAGLPATATIRPRFWLTTSDSCGVTIAGLISVSVSFGLAGSDMSSTLTPAIASVVSVGKSSVVS
jgi:hypothetical protein